MTIFWILAAGLVGLALLFAVTPLLQARGEAGANGLEPTSDVDQDQINLELFEQQVAELDADLANGKLDKSQYDAARRDLERELLHDLDNQSDGAANSAAASNTTSRAPGPLATALVLLIAVPVAALALYALVGNQSIIPKLELAAAGSVDSGGQETSPDGTPPLSELVTRLEQRLEQQPEDAEGWMMLGRTYFAMSEPAKAEAALAKAYALRPKNPQIILAYAESVASNNNNQLEGQPAALVSEALALAPSNPTAQWLAGMVAFQRGQFQSAATSWRKTLSQLDPSSADAKELSGLIDEAERRAGVPTEARRLAQATADAGSDSAALDPAANLAANGPAPGSEDAAPKADTASQSASTAAGDGLEVQVSLAPELADRYPPNTTVFVFARAAAGPPMPLAVQRVTVADLPLSVRLDDSMAMMPAMKLSGFPEVVVGARVSPSGQAMPQSGDLEGDTGTVSSATAEPLTVTIDRVRP